MTIMMLPQTRTYGDNGDHRWAVTQRKVPDADDDLTLAPHSITAEEMLLGAMLINPGKLREIGHFLRPADFFIQRHEWIWAAFQRLRHDGLAIDMGTVAGALEETGQLDEIGGRAYLAYLVNNTPTALHAEVYARLVDRAAVRRLLLTAAQDIAALAHDSAMDIGQVLDSAMSCVRQVTTSYGGATGSLSAREAAQACLAHLLEPAARVIPTGFAGLNTYLRGGLRRGKVYAIGGRPGMIKSGFALVIAHYVATKKHCGVLVTSLEMDTDEQIHRLIGIELGKAPDWVAHVNDVRHQPAHPKYQDALKAQNYIVKALEEWLPSLPLHFTESAYTPAALEAEIERRKADGVDIGLVLVDTVQDMKPDLRGINTQSERNSYIATELKRIAKQQDVAVLQVTHLNRECEGRVDKRPILADFASSSEYEKKADVVIMCYRDDAYDAELPEDERNVLEGIIRKSRAGDGKLGTLKYRVDTARSAIEEMT